MSNKNNASKFDFYNDKNKCIYIHIPKVAGISIEEALFGTKVGHKKAIDFMIEDEKKFDEYFKFTFVRNPYDRVVSAFYFLKNGGRNKFDKAWSEEHLSNIDTFEEFVIALNEEKFQNKITTATHFIPQYKYITDQNDRVILDYIGRFETLETDFNYVCKKLNIDTQLAHQNKTKHREKYQKLYTDEMQNIIYNIYKKDFELLEYSFKIDQDKEQKKNIYVHVGYPKAASTTLQKHLFNKHNEILNLGLYPMQNIGNDSNEIDSDTIYAKDEKLREFYGLLTNAHSIERHSTEEVKEFFDRHIKQYIDHSDKKIIFSHERLTSAVFSSNNYSLKAKRLAEVLPNSKIIVIIRDQYSWLKSQYRDHPFDPRDISKSKMIDFNEWFDILYNNDDLGILPLLNYYHVVDKYENLFGSKNVKVLLFEELVNNSNGFAQQLADFMGIDKAETEKILEDKHENVGVGHLFNLYRGLKRNKWFSDRIEQYSLEKIDRRIESLLKKSKKKDYELSDKNLELLNIYFEYGNHKLIEEENLDLNKYNYPLKNRKNKIKIGLYLENKNIANVDLSKPYLGNPGIGGTQFNFVSLVFYYKKYFNDVEFIIFANETKTLPEDFHTVYAKNCVDAYLLADKSSCTLFVWRPTLGSDAIELLDISPKHSLNIIAWMHSGVTALIDGKLAENNRVKAYVAVSEIQLKVVNDPKLVEKSFVICNGFDSKPYQINLPVKKDPYMVTYIGSIIPAKGFGLLAKVWKRVLEIEPKANLYVIGSGQIYNRNASLGQWGIADEKFESTEIRPYLSDENGDIHPSVHFLGTMGNEKIPYLQKTSVGVVNPTAQTENCPGSAIEFQAAQTPVVSKAEKGLLDTVLDKKTGLLGYTEEDLIKNIIFFLKNPKESYIYGERGQIFIEEKFNYQKIATQWQRLFYSIDREKNYE